MPGLVRPLLDSQCLSPLSALGCRVLVSPRRFQSSICVEPSEKKDLLVQLLGRVGADDHAQSLLRALWLAPEVTWGTRRVGILTCGFWHSFFCLKIAGSVAVSWGLVPLTEAGDSCEQPRAAEVAVGAPPRCSARCPGPRLQAATI